MTTRENNLLLQFMEMVYPMVYPKDLLRYLELTGLSFEEVAQVFRNSLTASSVVSVSETQDSTKCRLGPIPI